MTERTTLLEFPCEFAVKAVGRNNPEIDMRVFDIVRQHSPELEFSAVSTRLSKGDKYLSVTVTIQAHSQAQLDAIYQDLTACAEIIMAL